MDTDLTLLERYSRERDAQAYAELVRRYARLVYVTSLRITRNGADAEDVTQECFLAMARQSRQIRDSVAGWLHATARTRALDLIRGRQRRAEREVAAAECTARGEAGAWQQVEAEVDQAIGRLPEELRACVQLYYLAGRTQNEVAAELGIGQASVSRNLERGIELIRKYLADQGVVLGAGAAALEPLLAGADAVPQTLFASLGKIGVAGVGPAKVASSWFLKTAACVGIAAGVAAVPVLMEIAPATAKSAATTVPAAVSGAVAALPNGGTAELVGIGSAPGKMQTWWQPDGSAMAAAPCDPIWQEQKPTPVLVTEGNPRLKEAVAAALEMPDLTVMTPREYEADIPWYADVVVYDRYRPEHKPVAGSFLYIGAAPSEWQVPVMKDGQGAAGGRIAVSSWDRDHEALRNASLDNVTIMRCLALKPPAGAEVLAETERGPLIVFHHGVDREWTMVVGVGQGDSTWDADASYPVFIADALEYLLLSAHSSYRRYQVAVQVSGLPAGTGHTWDVSPTAANARGSLASWKPLATKGGRDVPGLLPLECNLRPSAEVVTVKLRLATDPVETYEFDRTGQPMGKSRAGFLPVRTSEKAYGAQKVAFFTLPIPEEQDRLYEYSVRAYDRAGREHTFSQSSQVEVAGQWRPTQGFDLPLDQVERFALKIRPYRYTVTFSEVPLRAGAKSDVRWRVEERRE